MPTKEELVRRVKELEGEVQKLKNDAAFPAPRPKSPAPAAKKGAKRSRSPAKKEHTYKMTSDVLILSPDGPRRTLMQELLARANAAEPEEPDTPRSKRKKTTPFDDDDLDSEEEMGDLVRQSTDEEDDSQQYAMTRLASRGTLKMLQANSPANPNEGVAAAEHVQWMLKFLDGWHANGNPEFSKEDNIHFENHLLEICKASENLFESEPTMLELDSPVYVFGDIHGNFPDLHFFLSELVNFSDLRYTPYSLLFLGDYVDRGPFALQCVAYLLALKCQSRENVFLLRGNHEDPMVNGDKDCYGEGAFLSSCEKLLGAKKGKKVWETVNKVFRFLPLAATLDSKIFCAHGGIPRFTGGKDERMSILTDGNFPHLASFSDCNDKYQILASDLCWADPADDEKRVNEYGFGENPRGGDTITFGSKAVDQWCDNNGFDLVFRAHQEKAGGLKLAKSARVVTIFSTSDYEGHDNGAGIVLVHAGRVRMIVKQPFSTSFD